MKSASNASQAAVDVHAKDGASDTLLRSSLLAALVGLLAGGAAYGLFALITLISNLVFFREASLVRRDVTGHTLGVLVLVVPALGGLVVGLMAKYGTSKIRGHGIPEAMEAVLTNGSRISPSVAVLKPISVAVAIGTGGPFGAEGPIIQTGGALGSILGQVLSLRPSDCKTLLACGAAAGMAATFSTPIAAVILGIELLLFEYKPRSFVPLVIATTCATAVRFLLLGHGSMFQVGAPDFGFPGAIPWYLPLGVICGLAAIASSKALYWVEDLFEHLPCDELWWPAIGGLVLGLIGFFVPRVLGVGYDTLSDLLNGRLALGLLALLAVAKLAALVFSLGSGTSGGLLAPLFTVGAALGGLYADLINRFYPAAHLSPGAFALVGMAALFGAAARAPFTFIIFAFELTRDYESVLPLMLVVVVAHAIALRFMRNSIMTEKLARRGLKVPHEYEADAFQRIRVADAMDPEPVLIPADCSVEAFSERLSRRDPALVRHQAWLLGDAEGRLAGILTRSDLVKALDAAAGAHFPTVLEAGTASPSTAYPDETLHEAHERMQRLGCGRLPVVRRDDPRVVVGYLGRADILKARWAAQAS